MDPRWKHPFTCVISGPTQNGKTHFVTQFLKYLPDMMNPPTDEVIWCYGEWQPGYETMGGVMFVEGLPKPETGVETSDVW